MKWAMIVQGSEDKELFRQRLAAATTKLRLDFRDDGDPEVEVAFKNGAEFVLRFEQFTMHDCVDEAVTLDYTNHKGERGVRKVVPLNIFFGTSEWHPGPAQWFMNVLDLDRSAARVYAMKDIHHWTAPAAGDAR